MIPHLIDGKPVESPSVLENINPATGEVLAEVALGGEREVALAVASAKEAFPKWAGLPARERARIMRRLGDLIERHVPELAELETDDTGLPIHQTSKQLIPRASENFYFFPKSPRASTARPSRSIRPCSITRCCSRWACAG